VKLHIIWRDDTRPVESAAHIVDKSTAPHCMHQSPDVQPLNRWLLVCEYHDVRASHDGRKIDLPVRDRVPLSHRRLRPLGGKALRKRNAETAAPVGSRWISLECKA
jgi:hypothetical protein